MALANLSDILERVYTEGGRQFNDAWGDLLKSPGEWAAFTSILKTNARTLSLPYIEDYPRFEDLDAVPGGNVSFSDLSAGTYGITPHRHGAGIKMKDIDLDDDAMGIVIARINELIDSAAVEMERQAFDCLKSGIAVTNYGACSDGTTAFFSATHYGYPAVGSIALAANQANYDAGHGSGPWYLLDCSKALKPIIMAARKDAIFERESADSSHKFETDEYRWKIEGRMRAGYGMWQRAYCNTNALTEDTLWTTKTAMQAFRNKKGMPLNVKPTHLLVAPADEQVAQNLLNRMYIQGTAAALSNEPVKALKLQLVVSEWLA